MVQDKMMEQVKYKNFLNIHDSISFFNVMLYPCLCSALIFQIKALEQKLIEFRTSHQKEEEDLEDAVRTMEDQLFEVKSDMEKRMRNLNLDFDSAHLSSPHGKPIFFCHFHILAQ